MPELVIPNSDGFQWLDVRRALKRVIEAAAPLATVHAEWKLQFAPDTSLGKVLPDMNGKGNHAGFVHSFMLGLQGETENGGDGGAYQMVGGATVDYELNFAVWGFYSAKSWRVNFETGQVIGDDSQLFNATAYAEKERRDFGAYVRCNPFLGLDSGRVKYVFPPTLDNMDEHPFSNGDKIIVVQNSVRVRVRESYA